MTTPDQTSPEPVDPTTDAFAQAAETLKAEAAQAEPKATKTEFDVNKLKTERDQFYEQWLRANAELDNFRKRMQREMELAARFSDLPLIRDILPALDNLSRSIGAAENDRNVDNLLTGLKMTVKQLDEIFSKYSAKPIATVGATFDPNLHDALMQVPTSEHPPMTVIQEVERGYTLHERVIRPAKVIVATAAPN